MPPRSPRCPGASRRLRAGLLGLLLAAATPVAAQQLAPPAADTAAALHRLFVHQRQGRQRALLVSGVSVVAYHYYLAYSTQETTREKIGTGLLATYLGFQTYQLARTVARLRRYRPAHEQRLLATLHQGQPLPHWCRRRLLPYLHPTPVAVLATPTLEPSPAPLPTPVQADSLAEVAREDTLLAVPRLFRAERRDALGTLVLAGLVSGTSAWLLATTEPATTYQRISTGGVGLLGAAATYELAGQLVRLRRFRPARERRVLDALENGQPLPRWVRRRLKPAYFSLRPTAL